MIPNGQEGLVCVTEDHPYARVLVLFPLLNVAWFWNRLKYLMKSLRAPIHKSQYWLCLDEKKKKIPLNAMKAPVALLRRTFSCRWRYHEGGTPAASDDSLTEPDEGQRSAGPAAGRGNQPARWATGQTPAGRGLSRNRASPLPPALGAAGTAALAGRAHPAPAPGPRSHRPRGAARWAAGGSCRAQPAGGGCGLQVGCAGLRAAGRVCGARGQWEGTEGSAAGARSGAGSAAPRRCGCSWVAVVPCVVET